MRFERGSEMKRSSIITIAMLIGGQPAIAQIAGTLSPKAPELLDHSGAPTDFRSSEVIPTSEIDRLLEVHSNLPLEQLSQIANSVFRVETWGTRSAKDVALYRNISPSVVLILSGDSLGSGSLISPAGDILTNWHVVNGATDVGVVFKPAVEGSEPTKDDIKIGHVVRFDPVADLALVKIIEVPRGRNPLRIGDGSDISVGIDVYAIGHPKGESWTYTKGIVSQYRPGFNWTTDNIKHKADVIQTQTPINPGNSGGPLLDESGALLGVNTFKATGEALNFAVSVDDVKRFIGRSSGGTERSGVAKKACEVKEIARFRNKENSANVISYDTRCVGRADANYTIPDNKSEAITLTKDRNGDGRVDVMYFDFKRQRKWDISFWDETFGGRWTLVGYHLDGSITPTQFESYETFQRRTASR
jgi:S1-C subfamily serine protease